MSFELDEAKITKLILEDFSEKFIESTEVDVGIVGAGPSGLTAARYLAEDGYKVVLFERKQSIGGGMWGGGMNFPTAVIQPEAIDIVEEMGINVVKKGNYYITGSIELATKAASSAIDAGVRIFNSMTVEDVVIRENDAVKGLVLNWSSNLLAGLHVDPLSIKSEVVIEASGHESDLLEVIRRKNPDSESKFKSQGIFCEKSMWAEKGEKAVVENTKEVYPNVIVAGMAANAAFSSPRMGPIFGGMLLSGKKAAEEAKKKLE